MSEDGRNPPEISISRTSSGSSKNEKRPQRAERDAKNPSDSFEYKTWKPQPWKYGTHVPPWKHRVHDPDLEWKIKWRKDCFPTGRVVVIDYISNEAKLPSSNGAPAKHVAVAAQEFEHLKDLEKFYCDPRRSHAAALRVVHVQNCAWGTGFLLRKFNIDHDSEMVGMQGFTKWARYTGPRQRNGKPFPNGRSWRAQTE